MPFSENEKNYVKKIIIPRNMLQNISMLHVLPSGIITSAKILAELFHVSVDYLLDQLSFEKSKKESLNLQYLRGTVLIPLQSGDKYNHLLLFPDCHPEALTELPRLLFRALSGSDSHSPVDSLEATDHADKYRLHFCKLRLHSRFSHHFPLRIILFQMVYFH